MKKKQMRNSPKIEKNVKMRTLIPAKTAPFSDAATQVPTAQQARSIGLRIPLICCRFHYNYPLWDRCFNPGRQTWRFRRAAAAVSLAPLSDGSQNEDIA
jgi:hypothetical protein